MTDGDRRILRYGLRERVVHTLAALTYVYLLLTGLAFWTPALYWMAIVLGGGYLSRMMHPWAGLVFAVVMWQMFAVWRRDMRTTDADRAWRKAMPQYIRNEDHRVPPAGRFNFGQKQLFWVMVWGTVVLLISGVVLWFPERVPPSVGVIREAAVLAHAVSALVTIGAFIIHLYMGLFVVRGGLHAIVHGDVGEAWAREHHPLWLDSRRDARR